MTEAPQFPPGGSPTLHLASSSPRRRDILAALGLAFTSGGVDIDECRLDGESPEQMVLRLARAKAAAAAGRAELVLGADTAVVLGGDVFGKPTGEDAAIDMLTQLSGRQHAVYTGVALQAKSGSAAAVSITDVSLREIRPDEARAYWHSGEPADKAGAYAIQGLGGAFVESIAGSYTGVVGLPVFETLSLLTDAGLDIFAK